tara:strand:- start:214 stop:486 length:273 start_codon:yes stop_codon:yes gene_type:complete
MIFKKDSAIFGLTLGIMIPICFYFLEENLIPMLFGVSFRSSSMELFALVMNLPIFRYYLMSLKYERTAKGILFATFVYGLIWVYVNQGIL